MIEKIATKKAPAALGPYTQAVKAGRTLYVSGLLGIDPLTGELTGENIEQQTEQICRNVDAILKEAGYSSDSVIKTVCYLRDLSEFQCFNTIYAKTLLQCRHVHVSVQHSCSAMPVS